jgi:hypothetical protein
MLAVDCSYGTCRKAATHRLSVEIRSGRAAGESVVLWVCEGHAKQASAIKKRGVLQRVRGIVAT